MAWAETRDRRIFNELLFTSYGGMSEDRLVGLAVETFERVIKPNIYPGARDLVQTCLDKGHDVVLVSGALKDIVAGSGLAFEERGAQVLKGVPGEWRLFLARPG